MDQVTIHIPLQLDSGPYCPAKCLGNRRRKSECMIFWQELHLALDRQGKILRTETGYLYKKCPECMEAVKQANSGKEDPKRTQVLRWTPPVDIFPSE